MKPIVGVMPLWDEEKSSIWMLPGYLDGIIQAGGLPFVFPFTDDKDDLNRLADMCDGFLFTGGQDVSPSIYGETPLDDLLDCCEKRDEMESAILKIAIKDQKSVLGICRGLQFINAALGGTLYQDIPLQHPSLVEHHQRPPYNIPAHKVHIIEGSPLCNTLKKESLAVNSYHHQAVHIIADGLKPMAVAPDGIVEALYKPSHRFLWAVQWHPEFSYMTDEDSRMIFRAFICSMNTSD